MQLENKSAISIEAPEVRVGIVVARFNKDITDGLYKSALEALTRSQVKEENIKTYTVAGSVELPYALQQFALTKKFNFLVALGCVIRGETPHFDYVCKMAQEGILKVSLEHNIPIGFGIITVNNLAQAEARLHLGAEATMAALELYKLNN